MRVRGEARGVAEEVRVGDILTTSNHHMEPAKLSPLRAGVLWSPGPFC